MRIVSIQAVPNVPVLQGTTEEPHIYTRHLYTQKMHHGKKQMQHGKKSKNDGNDTTDGKKSKNDGNGTTELCILGFLHRNRNEEWMDQ